MNSKIFATTGEARTPEQRRREDNGAHRSQVRILLKAPTWKRAHEIYCRYHHDISYRSLRDYASESRNERQLEVSCDAEEGIWWSDTNYSQVQIYHEIWSKPRTE